MLLLKKKRRPRVLLLGLAGGSVGQAVRVLAPEAELVGVDRDRDVLRAARRHFGMDALGIEVVADDAFRYLRRERRRSGVRLCRSLENSRDGDRGQRLVDRSLPAVNGNEVAARRPAVSVCESSPPATPAHAASPMTIARPMSGIQRRNR